MLGFDALARMDVPPPDRDRVDARQRSPRRRRTESRRRRRPPPGAHPCARARAARARDRACAGRCPRRRRRPRTGCSSRQPGRRRAGRSRWSLGGDDPPEPPGPRHVGARVPLGHPGAGAQRVVQRLVVHAVGVSTSLPSTRSGASMSIWSRRPAPPTCARSSLVPGSRARAPPAQRGASRRRSSRRSRRRCRRSRRARRGSAQFQSSYGTSGSEPRAPDPARQTARYGSRTSAPLEPISGSEPQARVTRH